MAPDRAALGSYDKSHDKTQRKSCLRCKKVKCSCGKSDRGRDPGVLKVVFGTSHVSKRQGREQAVPVKKSRRVSQRQSQIDTQRTRSVEVVPLNQAMRSAAKKIAENPSEEIDWKTFEQFVGTDASDCKDASQSYARVVDSGSGDRRCKSQALDEKRGVSHVEGELNESAQKQRALLYWHEMRLCRKRYLMLDHDGKDDAAGGDGRGGEVGMPLAKGSPFSDGGLRKCCQCNR